MSAARIVGSAYPVLLLVALLVVALVGGVLAVWKERKSPSYSPPEPVGDLAWWALLPAEEQEAYDTAVLDLAEQAELDAEAEDNAREAARHLAHRAQVNALYHP